MLQSFTRRATQHHASILHSYSWNSVLLQGTIIPGRNSRLFQNSASSSSKRGVTRKKGQSFIPRKAPVILTETARTFFKALLDNRLREDDNVAGILLKYQQSSTGEPRMVFSFDFVEKEKLGPNDEAVSLEIMEDGSPKPPDLSWTDDKPKLYIHHNAFMKVLGSKVDVDIDTFQLTLYDREGNVLDPND